MDEWICADADELVGVGVRELEGRVRAAGYERDPKAFVKRASQARGDRHVTVRPAPDTMTYLTGLLPVEQGVAVYQALTQQAASLKAAGDPRSKGQAMADVLVARVLGHDLAADGRAPVIPVCLNITIPVDSLAGGHAPGVIEGVPVPAELARRLAAAAITNDPSNPTDIPATGQDTDPVDDPAAGQYSSPVDGRAGDGPPEPPGPVRAWFRRLFTDGCGRPVALSSRQRLFGSGLAAFLDLRDQGICRTPYCDAPIRHHDHIQPWDDNGATDAGNGQGLCEACNHAKQTPRWRQVVLDHDGRHQVITVTPTGHAYISNAPPTPGASLPPVAQGPRERLDIGYPIDVEWELAA